jgi:hypothetical protein
MQPKKNLLLMSTNICRIEALADSPERALNVMHTLSQHPEVDMTEFQRVLLSDDPFAPMLGCELVWREMRFCVEVNTLSHLGRGIDKAYRVVQIEPCISEERYTQGEKVDFDTFEAEMKAVQDLLSALMSFAPTKRLKPQGYVGCEQIFQSLG